MEKKRRILRSSGSCYKDWWHNGLLYQSLFTNALVEHAYTKIYKQKNKHDQITPTIMPRVRSVSYNNRVHSQNYVWT